ncbi:pore-forming ESAT-6 family protein [Cellulomonas fimi]|uniref:Pore-forming ESAT-6 family protein n=1 Tax=Cellulomonas fimi TaxID=1708 RepID=A0A7Y0QIZ8_CELFI|nr:pore-forming ESAT-6 family protein [Cellulomonas fimi]NMR21753.1 pore-forming ESAT-6 family protein [Cellulomonas fimi]
MANSTDRRDYEIAASQTAQENFNAVAQRLEALIDERDRDVKTAMADYLADGVSEDYATKEARWNQVAGEVRTIIGTLRGALEKNDATAQDSLKKAKAAVDAIG